jgi:hypothetical protein
LRPPAPGEPPVAAQRVIIVGAGSAGRLVAREIAQRARLGLVAVGFVDDDPSKLGARIEGTERARPLPGTGTRRGGNGGRARRAGHAQRQRKGGSRDFVPLRRPRIPPAHHTEPRRNPQRNARGERGARPRRLRPASPQPHPHRRPGRGVSEGRKRAGYRCGRQHRIRDLPPGAAPRPLPPHPSRPVGKRPLRNRPATARTQPFSGDRASDRKHPRSREDAPGAQGADPEGRVPCGRVQAHPAHRGERGRGGPEHHLRHPQPAGSGRRGCGPALRPHLYRQSGSSGRNHGCLQTCGRVACRRGCSAQTRLRSGGAVRQCPSRAAGAWYPFSGSRSRPVDR